MQRTDLTQFSSQALLDGISALLGCEREITAKLLAHLGEVEERRLHLEMGHSSLFDFCVARYKMSEGPAFRPVLGARLARRFPIILSLIGSGKLHLSALQMLGERLTPDNHVELLDAACQRSKRELEAWLAARFPKPDVPAQIRTLPAPHTQSRAAAAGVLPEVDGVPVRRPNERGRLEPLSQSRFKVEFTASAALREKLERARDLMSHANPNQEIANVVESALDLLLEKLESRRLGKRSARGGSPAREQVNRALRASRATFAGRSSRATASSARSSGRMAIAARRDHFWSSTTSTRSPSVALATSLMSASDVARTISSGPSRRSGASTSPPVATFAGESLPLRRPIHSGPKRPATRRAWLTSEPSSSNQATLWTRYASPSESSGFETPKRVARSRAPMFNPF